MSHTSPFSFHAAAGFLLLCGTCAAIFFGIAGQISLNGQTVQPTDAQVQTASPYTIVLDAGHGGEDGGTQSADGLLEKTVNLAITQTVYEMLHGCGVETVMTREEDILLYDRNTDYKGRKKMLDLATRRKIAEETDGAIFVSIHMNAFPETQYRGLQVFYSPNDPCSQILADTIQNSARALLEPSNEREIKAATSAIYLLDRLECPAVLVECGFLSNPQEAALFETEEHRQKVAFVLFCALMSYISAQNA